MEDTRLVAITSEDGRGLDGRVSAHFGRCPAYTLVEVRDGRPGAVRVVDNPFAASHAPGVVPAFLRDLGADVVITGGMGPRAIAMFERFGTEVVTGASGRIGEALETWLAGELAGTEPCAEHEHHGDHADDHR